MEIKFKEVEYITPVKTILKDLSFTLQSFSTNVIVGKSGSGKTTLLKGIDAQILPSAGIIEVGDMQIHTNMHTKFNSLRNFIGYIPLSLQNSFLKETVIEELQFSLSIHPFQGNREDRIRDIMEEVGLDYELLYAYIDHLTYAEQKKLSIATALIYDPQILLFDEPIFNQNDRFQKEFIQLCFYLKKKKNKTIVIATKNTDFALKIADKIVLLGDQRVEETGDKYSILSDEKRLSKCGLDTPKLLQFSNLVMKEEGTHIGYRDDINDLIKDIFRYVQ